jgi:predicted ATPase
VQDLPTGTVTFLFSDIEGSTQLLDELGAERYADALAEHRRLMRDAFLAHGGVEVDTQGDAFFAAFPDAPGALAAAGEAQEALAGGPIRIRIGLHTGTPLVTAEGYVGIDVHRGARVMSAGHGGQILVSEATHERLDGVGLTDLGLHRLKDLTEPQRLWQLGGGEFPPLKTLYQTNLPVQPTPLIGREAELAQVLELLKGARLLTLTGAGGSGKTRLALQAAAELVDEFEDGVWWVSLAALRDPELVEPTIAQAVGAKDGLGNHLRQQETLLLLDNFEQLLEAAPAIAELFAQAPDLRVLVTSRERLGLSAEQEYPVPTLIPVEAVALFTARARQLKPGFEPDERVEEICRRLDGLPLALELAAARVKVLMSEQILDRLAHSLELLTGGARDVPERQQTLRATIEWSHELLDDSAKELFARLAVFAGSFDLDAAEAICEADLDALGALVDKSLLRPGQEGRFFMLETIGEYALGQLDASGEAEALKRRHSHYFRSLAETAEPELTGAAAAESLARLDAEQANLRRALEWSIRSEKETALRLCAALERFWVDRGSRVEGSRWLEAALRDCENVPESIRARAVHAAASIAIFLDERERAQELLEQSLMFFRELDAGDGVALCLAELGAIAVMQRDFDLAFERLEEALEIYRQLGDLHGVARTLHLFGEAKRDQGDRKRGLLLLEESLRLSLQGRDVVLGSATMHSLGDLALDERDAEGAAARYSESLALGHSLGLRAHVNNCLAGLAAAAALDGRLPRAARLWGAAEALEDELGSPLLAHERSRYEPLVAEACERHHEAWGEGRAMALDQAVAYALTSVD